MKREFLSLVKILLISFALIILMNGGVQKLEHQGDVLFYILSAIALLLSTLIVLPWLAYRLTIHYAMPQVAGDSVPATVLFTGCAVMLMTFHVENTISLFALMALGTISFFPTIRSIHSSSGA